MIRAKSGVLKALLTGDIVGADECAGGVWRMSFSGFAGGIDQAMPKALILRFFTDGEDIDFPAACLIGAGGEECRDKSHNGFLFGRNKEGTRLKIDLCLTDFGQYILLPDVVNDRSDAGDVFVSSWSYCVHVQFLTVWSAIS